jgi:hypothetical protein
MNFLWGLNSLIDYLQVPIEEPSADLAEGKIIVDDDDLNEDSEHMNF